MDTEEVLLEVVAGGEGFRTKMTSMVPLVEVNPKNVTCDSRFIAKRSAAPVADKFRVFMRSSNVRLQSVGLVEWSSAEATTEARI